MSRDGFPEEVIQQLKWYVYRLVDPRNGETFYVGKGRGNRIFTHLQGAISAEHEKVSDPKLLRIKEIQLAGLEVSHVIHRHGIAAEHTAHEVEAALIDAYPGLTNKVRGHGSEDHGSRHVEEIIAEFEAEDFVVGEPLILICINNRFFTHSTYDAVRAAWKISASRSSGRHLVLAHVRGIVKGAYRPQKWLQATKTNFGELLESDVPDRRGFVGEDAEDAVWCQYVGKRVPERYKVKGAKNPVRYCDPGE